MKYIYTFLIMINISFLLSCEKKVEKKIKFIKPQENKVMIKTKNDSTSVSPLKKQLSELAEKARSKRPEKQRQIMTQAIEDLKKSQIMKTALKKGDKIPHFKLRDIYKGAVTSQELLKKGPLLIVFYRGGWCPYCNLQLRDLQFHLKEIKETGAELVAISPEAPDETAKTIAKQKIDYYVLSDRYGGVGKAFGLMFELPKELISLYKEFSIHLDQSNGHKKWELPLAATYIVNQKGIIEYAFIEADYKLRAETSELILKLKSL